jgi:hypothetical protein
MPSVTRSSYNEDYTSSTDASIVAGIIDQQYPNFTDKMRKNANSGLRPIVLWWNGTSKTTVLNRINKTIVLLRTNKTIVLNIIKRLYCIDTFVHCRINKTIVLL